MKNMAFLFVLPWLSLIFVGNSFAWSKNGNDYDPQRRALADPRSSLNGRMSSFSDYDKKKEEMFKEKTSQVDVNQGGERDGSPDWVDQYDDLIYTFRLKPMSGYNYSVGLFLNSYDSRRAIVSSLKESAIDWFVIPMPTAVDIFCDKNPLSLICEEPDRGEIQRAAARLRSLVKAGRIETFGVMNKKKLSNAELMKLLPSEMAASCCNK